MRLLAIGDIHGCYNALSALEKQVPIAPDDLVVTVGDYIDRGPGSSRVLDWLIERDSAGRLIALLGNHELMMLAARDGGARFDNWIFNGGDATLQSYVPANEPERLDSIPAVHWQFLENDCRPYFETETHFFVHANVYSNYPLADQPDNILYWEHLNNWSVPHESGKIMICGHTPQRTGIPLNLGHAICIDTHAYAGGWLTCLDVAAGRYWQANEQGETRSGQISVSKV